MKNYKYKATYVTDDLNEYTELLELIETFEKGEHIVNNETIEYVPYQVCPRCGGSGQLVQETNYVTSSLVTTCDVCFGAKIIPMCPIDKTKKEK